MTDNSNQYLNQLKELGKRNAKLSESLAQLLSQYENVSTNNEQYQNLLREFGLDEVSRRQQQKGIRQFRMVSMLYIVVYGFRELSQLEDAGKQLDILDEIIFELTDISRKYNMMKIATVGDNILFASGIPTHEDEAQVEIVDDNVVFNTEVSKETKTSPIDASLAAYEMMNKVAEIRQNTNCVWNISVGLHTGPAMGRFANQKAVPYALQGYNVLTVSRLALCANVGEIMMSPMTNALVKEFFIMEKACTIPVKYSGTMDLYQLKDLRPEMKGDCEENPYSEAFDLSYSRLQFMDIQELMLDTLEKMLPANLYYHNVKHTIDVTTEVELIGWSEGLPETDVLLLKVAALFHDTGHIIKYGAGHEENSCKFVQEILPNFKYSQEKIDKIKRIIMATKLPHQPSDIMESVIQDADLDYLGRADFIPVSNDLYRELKERNMVGTIDQWNENQIKFISAHQYYTKTAHSLREVNKQIQIERIKAQLPQ